MAWIMDEYSKHCGISPGVVTRKPVHLFGSEGREEATGRGVMYALDEALQSMGKPLKGTTVALQGFGNVGSHAARLLAEQGALIVAVADHLGGVKKDDGLDIPALFEYAQEHRTVTGFPGGDSIENTEIIGWDADALIPAALEDAITVDNANEVRAKIIVEAANSPSTPEADEILLKRDVLVVPDILANAGGVTVSYFEWTQNIQRYRWEYDQVVQELEKFMRRAYRNVAKTAGERSCNLRTAAYLLAIQRVGQAVLSRRSIHKDIKLI